MCGRYTQKQAIRKYMEGLSPDWQGVVEVERKPTWNLAPTAFSWLIYGESTLIPTLLRWGYRYNAEDKGLAPISARVETAAEKYLFRDAWKTRRCVVPADGWYEWKVEAAGKQPYYFSRRDGNSLYLAGLSKDSSYCLFTTAADGELTNVHDRKPLSLEPADALAWIREPTTTDSLISAAVKAEAFTVWPVNKAVSNWRNDGPQLIEGVA